MRFRCHFSAMGFYEERPPRHGHRTPSELAEDAVLSIGGTAVSPRNDDQLEEIAMYKSIMVPTEGSDNEQTAISLGARLAQRFDAKLHLVRVQSAPLAVGQLIGPSLISDEVVREERRAAARKLDELGAKCGRRGVITALEDGPVGPSLRDYAARVNVDLIVMCSRSRSGMRRVLLGSITDYLVRHTNVPVLIVKPPLAGSGTTPQVPFSRIVVPLDGSALAEQTLSEVERVASRQGSTINLLHVLTPATYSQNEIMQPGLPWWDHDIEKAEAYLANAARNLTDRGFTVGTNVVLSDDIASAVIDFSVRSRADLIAIATRGVGGMSRLIFGTTADEISRKSPISVLVFHPRSGAVPNDPGARTLHAVTA